MVAATSTYQGGPFLEVFSGSGSNPLVNCKLSGEKGVQKVYEKGVKGYVYNLSGAASKLQLPKDERKGPLQYVQQFLVLQVCVPAGQHFALELGVTDGTGSKRKLYFSTSFHEVKTTPLHCQVPLTALERDTWLNLTFDLVDLFGACFRGVTYRSLDLLVLGSVCRVRKIFTLRQQPINSGDPLLVGEPVPVALDYPTGVPSKTQVLNAPRIRGAIIEKRGDATAVQAAAAPKRASAGGRVAFGSRTPAPLVVVPANVEPSLRGGVETAVKKGGVAGSVRKAERTSSARKVSAVEIRAPSRGDDEDAGEEWSPTQHGGVKAEPNVPLKTQSAPKSKSGGIKAPLPKGGVAKKAGNGLIKTRKDAGNKLPVRAESPVAAWGHDTPEELLLASMSAEWKQKLEGGETSAERSSVGKTDAALDGERGVRNATAETPRESDSRSSSRSELRTVRFSEDEGVPSRADTPNAQPDIVRLSGNRASQEPSPRGVGLEGRDVLADLERELAGLTAGTKNSPRAVFWRSETDGFTRRSPRGNVPVGDGGLARNSPRLAGTFLRENDDSKTIREEKLQAVAAMEGWDEDESENALHDGGVNGRESLENGLENDEEWDGENTPFEEGGGVNRRHVMKRHSGDVSKMPRARASVNRHWEVTAGTPGSVDTAEHDQRTSADEDAVNGPSETPGVNAPLRLSGVNASVNTIGVHVPSRTSGVNAPLGSSVVDGRNFNEHFEVHHEDAGSGRASDDTWRSRRSNSRYSQDSDDSDVTPRVSKADVSMSASKGAHLNNSWEKQAGPGDSGSARAGRASRSLLRRDGVGEETEGPLTGRTELEGGQDRRPTIDWELEDDGRSSLGSLEGSEWGASLSSERRGIRGSSRVSTKRSGVNELRSETVNGFPASSGSPASSREGSKTRGSSRESLETRGKSRGGFGTRGSRESIAEKGPESARAHSSRSSRRDSFDVEVKKSGQKSSRRTSAVETSLSEWTAPDDVAENPDVSADVAGGRLSGARWATLKETDGRSDGGRTGGNGESALSATGLEETRGSSKPSTSASELRSSIVAGTGAAARSRPASAAHAHLRASLRPKDMDLLFDPILKCFYDPKTNKYYELKEDDEPFV